jgi:hypothetical protein
MGWDINTGDIYRPEEVEAALRAGKQLKLITAERAKQLQSANKNLAHTGGLNRHERRKQAKLARKANRG